MNIAYQHSYLKVLTSEQQTQFLYEGGLASPRRTGDPQSKGRSHLPQLTLLLVLRQHFSQ